MEGLTEDEKLMAMVCCLQLTAAGALLLLQLDDIHNEALLELDVDIRSDVMEGTGRWTRKPKPWEERFWENEARYTDSATFLQMFRCRYEECRE